MTAHTPFGLDHLETFAALIGNLEYAVDPLNGADTLFYAAGMAEQARKIAAAYKDGAWAPRDVRLFEKSVIPPGHIVGFRMPNGMEGPYADVVFMVAPRVDEPDDPSIETLAVIEPGDVSE